MIRFLCYEACALLQSVSDVKILSFFNIELLLSTSSVIFMVKMANASRNPTKCQVKLTGNVASAHFRLSNMS